MKKIVETKDAPAPIGPYNQAVTLGNLAFISGQIAIDPLTGKLILDDIESETHQVMKNVGAVLKKAGYRWEDVLKASIFLADMDQFPDVNKVYGSYFSDAYPARECVEVKKLPKGVNVEISVIAGSEG
jgi:2-iminobutanoate/2-iminopropanoate deaminase